MQTNHITFTRSLLCLSQFVFSCVIVFEVVFVVVLGQPVHRIPIPFTRSSRCLLHIAFVFVCVLFILVFVFVSGQSMRKILIHFTLSWLCLSHFVFVSVYVWGPQTIVSEKLTHNTECEHSPERKDRIKHDGTNISGEWTVKNLSISFFKSLTMAGRHWPSQDSTGPEFSLSTKLKTFEFYLKPQRVCVSQWDF